MPATPSPVFALPGPDIDDAPDIEAAVLPLRDRLEVVLAGFAYAHEGGLMVARGEVNADGTVARGSGFTVNRIAVGQYGINVTGYTGNRPTVVCTPLSPGFVTAGWSGSVPLVKTYDPVIGNGAIDLAFSFVAIGVKL